MLKRPIKYTDYNGKERTEDFYFNLNKAEIFEMQNSVAGGLEGILNRISATNELIGIVAEMKRLLLASIGMRTDDGKFVKSDQIRTDFESSAAYPVIFMELATDNNVAAAFIEGVLPADLVAATAAQTNQEMLANAQASAPVAVMSAPLPPLPPNVQHEIITNDIGDSFKAPTI